MSNPDPRGRVLLNTLVLYALTLAVGVWAAWRHVAHPELGVVAPLELSWTTLAIFAAVFFIFTAAVVRWARLARLVLPALFFLIFTIGAEFIFASVFAWGTATLLAVLAISAGLVIRRVFSHDLMVLVGIAGLTAIMGLSIPPLVACALLAALSVYDIISVYRTRHMVAMAGRMIDSGFVFGFLLPAKLNDFFMPVRTALDKRSVMMLGSGDIGLPLVLAASAVSVSPGASIMVCIFALVGVMIMEWLFTHQKRPIPMAALPPIALAAILGYLIAVLVGL